MAPKEMIGDYVTLQRGTTYKGSLVGKSGPALLGLGSIRPGGGFRERDYKTYGGDCPEKLMLYPGDLFVSLKGATKDGDMIGSIARVPSSVSSGRLTQDTVKLVFKEPDESISKYIYWLLRTPDYRAYCAGRATGSAVAGLSREDFLSYPVPAPTSERMIAVQVLEALEEKIELNRRMNETLEETARAIFKSWFADFDPVRAKAEGRQPAGMSADLAILFPSALERGMPAGWKAQRLDVLCELGRGASPRPIHDYMGGDFPWIKIADATGAGGPFIYETAEKLKREGIERSVKVAPGDLILSNSATCGVPVFVDLEGCIHDGWLYFKNLRSISTAYLFFALKDLSDHLVHIADGSVQKNLNTGLVGQQQIIVPAPTVITAFDSLAQPIFMQIRNNGRESRALAELRDALLPKLLSGEVRLRSNRVGAGVGL